MKVGRHPGAGPNGGSPAGGRAPATSRVLLAVETSGPVGSLAVARGERVLGRIFLDGASTHAARVIPALGTLLEGAGLDRAAVQGVVVGSGPGSFTGVRVAAATAKGLVHALGLPLWAVSSLAAAAVADRILAGVEGPWKGAAESRPPGSGVEASPAPEAGRGHGADLGDPGDVAKPGHVGASGLPVVRSVLFDARGDRVYAASYRIDAGGMEVLRPPRATRIGRVLAEPRPAGLCFVGDGAVRHREALAGSGGTVLPPPAGVPAAEGLLHVMALWTELEPVEDSRRWEPDYLRASGAERSRSP